MSAALPYPFVILVSDGRVMRSIHPPALGQHRAAVEFAIAAAIVPAAAEPVPVLEPKGVTMTVMPSIPARRSADSSTMTQGEIAREKGFTGNACASCGGFNMRRSGTCETCECGSTSGGCS